MLASSSWRHFIQKLTAGIAAFSSVVCFAAEPADIERSIQLLRSDDHKSQLSGVASLTELAKTGDKAAAYELGCLYYNGVLMQQDYVTAIAWWTKSANAGDGRAAFNLSSAYLNGKGVPEDIVQGVAWLKRGAELNDNSATNELGRCYLNGTGVVKSEIEALKWFRRSADAGNPIGIRNVGVVYYFSSTKLKNCVDGVQWFQKAANLGNPDAMWNLSLAYLDGFGIAQDERQSVEWAEKAANAGNTDAKAFLAKVKRTSTLAAFRQQMLMDVQRDLNSAQRKVQNAPPKSNARRAALDDVHTFKSQKTEYTKMEEDELAVRLVYAYASADGLFHSLQDDGAAKLTEAQDAARKGNIARQNAMAEQAQNAFSNAKLYGDLRNRYWEYIKQLEPASTAATASFILENRQLSDYSLRASLDNLKKIGGLPGGSNP